MAIEAANILSGRSDIRLVEIKDLNIGRAIAFDDDSSTVETLFDVKIIHSTTSELHAEFACCSADPHDHAATMALNANGTITITIERPEADTLPYIETEDLKLSEIAVDRFYDSLSRLGYGYSWPFHGTTDIRRKADYARGTIEDQSGSGWEDQLIVHPGMLDTALQTGFAAFCCPGDERMWTLHVPTHFQSIVLNPYFTSKGIGKQRSFQFHSVITENKSSRATVALNLSSQEGSHTFMQIEGMELVPLSAALPRNDAVLFSKFEFKNVNPDGELSCVRHGYTTTDIQTALDSERISFYYLRQLVDAITPEEKASTLPHYRRLLDWADDAVDLVARGENTHIPANAKYDTKDYVNTIITKYVECEPCSNKAKIG